MSCRIPGKKIAETFWLLRRWFVVGWFFWTLENGITHCCAGPKRLLQSQDIGTQRCRRWLWRAGIAQSTISMAFQRRLMRYIPICCAWTSSRAPFAWEEYVSFFFFVFMHFKKNLSTPHSCNCGWWWYTCLKPLAFYCFLGCYFAAWIHSTRCTRVGKESEGSFAESRIQNSGGR